MKTIILLLSVMMITSIATAKRPGRGNGNGNGKRYKSEQCDGDGNGSGESVQKHERRRNRDNMTPEEIKKHEERLQQRLRRMSKGDEAEYNRLMDLRKNDPKAFRAEMQARRAKMNKNRKHNRKKNKGGQE